MSERTQTGQSLAEENARLVRRVQELEEADNQSRQREAARSLARFTIEAASDALEWIALDGRILDVNEAACRMLGYTRAELLQLRVPDIDPHYDAAVWPRHFDDLRERGSIRLETEQRAKDGRLVPVEVVANYVKHGDIELNCAFLRDITERKKIEAAMAANQRELAESIALLEATGQIAAVGGWSLEVETSALAWTAETYRIHEVPSSAPMDVERAIGFYAPEARSTISAAVQECIERGTSFDLELPLVTAEGRPRTVRAQGNAEQVDGRTVRLIGAFQDTTERRRIEAELRENEATFRSVLDTSADAILLQDSTAAFVDCNQAALDLMKMTREQFINMTPDQISVEFQPNGRRSEEYAPEMTALGRKGFHRFEWTCRNLEGGEFIVEVSLVPFKRRGENMLHCTWLDITERITRQRQEAEARRLSDALNEINALLSSTIDPELVMDEVCGKAVVAAGASSVALLHKVGEAWTVMSHSGPASGLNGSLVADEVSRSIMEAMRADDPVAIIVGSGQDDDRLEAERALMGSLALVAPVGARESAESALIIGREAEGPGFSDAQTDFSRKLAVSLSMSLEKERLYAQQQRVADALQDGFLSMPSEVVGLDFGHLYHASDDVARVGGDFYDLFELGENRAGIILGDVSGHGLWVTTFTAMVRSSIRAYMFDGSSPAQAMQKTNRMLIARQHDDIFVTVWCGLLDRGSGYLQYCGAGHPSAVVKRKEGGASTLAGRSMMLGALPDAHYHEHQALLEVGDALVLYTDGVTEARSSHGSGRRLFGEKRLLKLIEGLAAKDQVGDIPPAILSAILKYAEDGLVDDVAILALSRNSGA